VGADPDQLAILDNFCWGNPTFPDRLGSLVRTCQGCYDAALAYRTPFISGKDSLFNEFNGRPIPPTLLISAIGIVPDIEHTATSDFKTPGSRIYLVGETRPELGGSLLQHLLSAAAPAGVPAEGVPRGRAAAFATAPAMPPEPLVRYRALHAAIGQGLVLAAHDLSEGGLAVALAEMCIGGRLGAAVTLEPLLRDVSGELDGVTALFAESNGRLLVEVAETSVEAFEALLAGTWLAHIGEVHAEPLLAVGGGAVQIELPVAQLVGAWKGEAA
jgi:phosphoribosylformylglycinamidine synthase